MLYFCIFFLTMSIIAGSQLENTFTHCYHNMSWGKDLESVSGNGSTLAQTSTIRKKIPQLFKDLNIKIVLDAACGDFNWMKEINLSFLEQYIGMDIVGPLIQSNKRLYERDNKVFIYGDFTSVNLPLVDLILCRDVFIHFTYHTIFKSLKNFKKSGAKYLLTTTFPKLHSNHDIKTDGGWRIINMEIPPFNFPSPILLINEDCTEDGGTFADKSLGLWDLDTIELVENY